MLSPRTAITFEYGTRTPILSGGLSAARVIHTVPSPTTSTVIRAAMILITLGLNMFAILLDLLLYCRPNVSPLDRPGFASGYRSHKAGLKAASVFSFLPTGFRRLQAAS